MDGWMDGWMDGEGGCEEEEEEEDATVTVFLKADSGGSVCSWL